MPGDDGVTVPWKCPACGSGNRADAPACLVCDAPPPSQTSGPSAPAQAVVPVVSVVPASRPLEPGASVSSSRLPAPSLQHPPIGADGTGSVPAAAGVRQPVGKLMLAVTGIVAMVIGVGFGAYMLTKPDGGPAAGSLPVVDGPAVDDGDPPAAAADSEPSGTGPASDDGSGAASSDGVTPQGGFRDDAHRVQFALPSELALVQDFDGASARWQAADLTFEYRVVSGGTVTDAKARYAGALGSLATVTYDNDTPEGRTDGRYVVSGLSSDGGAMYERGKVRCGDLVFYRLTWTFDESMPLVDQLTTALVNEDPELDAMGGDYASC